MKPLFRRRAGSQFVTPTAAEFDALVAIVLRAYPALRLDASRGREIIIGNEPRDQVLACFAAIAHWHRTPDDALTMKFDRSVFYDTAETIARELGLYGDIHPVAFMTAVIMHGDIAYAPLADYPQNAYWGLVGPNRTGRPASDGWRRVLAEKKVLAPTALPQARTRNYEGPRPQIRGGNSAVGEVYNRGW